ncbi:MAG: type II secretion system F family protein [Actinomycetota bacterium]|nr:type II secretion system F family protein [Actinomycetota bacterium]
MSGAVQERRERNRLRSPMTARGVVQRSRVLAVAFALVALFATAASAAEPVRIANVDAAGHPEVVVTVSLPRTLVAGELDATDVRLYEGDAERPVSVAPLSTDQLEVVLLMDTSGSMAGQPLAAAKAAAKTFLAAVPNGVRVAVVGFGSQPARIAAFSSDLTATAAAIDGLQAQGETALYDAVAAAASQFANSQASHRAIVLLSDGGDTASRATVEGAAASLSAVGTSLHAIELGSGTGNANLQQLASGSRGQVVSASDSSALAGIYAQLASQLTNQYVLRYRSEARGPTPLRVSIAAGGGPITVEQVVDFPATGAPRAGNPPRAAHSWFAGNWPLILGAALVYAALAVLGLVLLVPRQRRARLLERVGSSDRSAGRTAITDLAERVVGVAEGSLKRRGWHGTLNRLLERAGLSLRPGELIVLIVCASVVSGGLGRALSGPGLGLLFAVIPPVLARLLLSVLGDRRTRAFAEQLPDILQLLSGSLRAGYGMLQAIDSVAREADAPAGVEFRRLLLESRLGRDLGDALGAMAERLDNEDFRWVVQAIEINREVGGDLAEVLDTVAATIREREQIRRQIRALSAEGRLSGYILLGLPFVVGTLMFLKDPSYPLELVRNGPIGFAMIAAGLFLMTVGALWIKRIARLVF